jgi:hypothetical protein
VTYSVDAHHPGLTMQTSHIVALLKQTIAADRFPMSRCGSGRSSTS